MTVRMLIVLLTLTMSASAVGSEYVFDGVPADGQEMRYTDGESVLKSFGPRSALGASLHQDSRKRLRLVLYLQNRGINDIDFSLSDVRAISSGADLDIVSPDELIRSAKRKANWKKAAVGLAGGYASGVAASSAGRTHFSGTASVSSVNEYGYRERVRSEVRFRGTIHDPNAAAAERDAMIDRTAQAMGSIRSATDDEVAAIEQFAIRRTTIEPGNDIFGHVAIEGSTLASPDIQIVVKARNDIHVLSFRRTTADGVRVPAARVGLDEPMPQLERESIPDEPQANSGSTAREIAIRRLTRLHPDWREIDNSQEFKAWLAAASDEIKALSRSSDPNDVAKVLAAYKDDLRMSARFRIKE